MESNIWKFQSISAEQTQDALKKTNQALSSIGMNDKRKSKDFELSAYIDDDDDDDMISNIPV